MYGLEGNLRHILHQSMQPVIEADELSFDSPIEEEFAHRVQNYLGPDVDLETQVIVPVGQVNYRLDFRLTSRGRGRCIGIECDGREYHKNKRRDQNRDMEILHASACEAIYRLRGGDIWFCDVELIHVLAVIEHAIFSDRARKTPCRLATANRLDVHPGWWEYLLLPDFDGGEPRRLLITRLPPYKDQHVVRNNRGDLDFKIESGAR